MALTKIPGHLLDKSAHIDFADNERLRIGTDNDLQIYYDGNNNLIQGSAGNVLYIQGRAGVNSILAVPDGAVNLYHNNNLKLETFAAGVSVTGQVNATTLHVPDGINGLMLGNSNDTKFYHDANNTKITHTGSGGLYLGADTFAIQRGNHSENYLAGFVDGTVEIYHNGAVKLATDAAGINVTGGIDVADITATGNVSLNSDGGTLYLGAGADLRIFHDGNNSFINNTTATAGALSIKSHDINLMSTGSEQMAKFEEDGPVRLYHDNAQKLMTLSSGINITGDLEVSGNLNITGDINSTSVTNLDVTDKTITVANNAGSSSAADGAGLIVDTGGTLPSLLWDHSNSAFQFSKAVRVVNTVRIVGGDTSGSSYGLIVKNSSNANTLLVQNDGVVKIDTNYLYVTNSGGIYSTGSIKARGGIQNDQGDLTLNDTVQVAGPMVIQGSGSQERYLAFTLDGKSSAFSGSNNCFIFNGQGGSGDYLAGALYLQSRSATAGREIGFITGTTPAKRMVITSTGNVGIGVTDPDVRFEVSGSARFAQENHAWTFDDTINNRLGFVKKSGNYTVLASGSGTPIIFSTSNNSNLQSSVSTQTFTERMQIAADGRVSFGPDASDILIDPASTNSNNNLIYMRGNASGDKSSIQMNHYGSADYHIGVGHVAAGKFNIANELTGNDFVIDTAGNVGIGTDSPAAKLHVQDAGDSQILIYETGSSPYTATLKLASQSTTAYGANVQYTSAAEQLTIENFGRALSAANSTGGIRFRTKVNNSSMQDVLTINGYTGRVGIGTNTGQPSSPLHIKSDTEFQLKIEASASAGASQQLYTPGGYAYTVYQNGSATWRQGAYGGSNYILRNHGTSIDEFTLLPSGSLKLQTATQSETGIAQLELQNNVNANPSHVNIKFNTYAWLGLIQCEQRAAGQYGALNFWTANNGNPTQKMCLNNYGNLCLATSANQDGVNPKHRVIAVTGSTTVTATSWSVSPGSNGGYDVSNDDASEFDYNGAYTGAGYYNRHIAKFCLVGNYTADTWYPIVASDQLFDWVSSGSPGANPWDGFSMYFRIYTYDISAGGSEYLSHRMTDRIWVNGYTCNSNQRHHIAIGAGWGHAPNGGQSNDHQDYASNPYQMSVNHHYNSDSYYPAKQTVEFKFKTARTGLTEAHSAQSVYVYAYVG